MSLFFTPESFIISNITQSNPAIVTTAIVNNFQSGLYVRIDLPGNFGMRDLNGNVYLSTILSPTTFSIPVDTSNFDSFTTLNQKQSPQVIPVGEVALTLKNAVKNGLPPIAPGN